LTTLATCKKDIKMTDIDTYYMAEVFLKKL